MKAAILENGELTIRDVPIPDPGPEEILVKLVASGVCHSDLHLVKGDWPGYNKETAAPLGHEGIGIVEKLGARTDGNIQVGDRVILGLGGAGGGYWCGACEFCLSDRPRLCAQAQGLRGTYAEYIKVWAKAVVKLPDTIKDTDASLACGGLTAYSAVKKLVRFNVTPGKPIAIIGAAGGLGHYAVQIAKAFGYRVVGIDMGPAKIKFLKNLGVEYPTDVDDAISVCKKQLGGVYASIVFSTSISGFQLGLDLLKRGSVYIAVGMPAASEGGISIGPLDLLRKDPLIMPSAVGTVEEMRELIQLAADGKVVSHISRECKLSEINHVFDELENRAYSGRAVITDLLN